MERTLRGMALCAGATVCFSTSDAMAKYLTGELPPIEIAWVRYVVFTLLAASPLVRPNHASMRSRSPRLQILRGLGVVASAVFFIMALSQMPIAEATTIGFASPLLITVLSVLMLRENVRLGQWLAVTVGFAGVLVVVRPAGNSFHPAAIWVILSSVSWSIAMIITRRIATTERSTTTLLWTAASGLVVLTVALPFRFVAPDLASFGLALAIGVAASSGQWLTILAYRDASASVLAPLTYTQLIWSSLYGLLIFHTLPDMYTLLGAAIIAGSGFYTVQVERARVRRQHEGTAIAARRPLWPRLRRTAE